MITVRCVCVSGCVYVWLCVSMCVVRVWLCFYYVYVVCVYVWGCKCVACACECVCVVCVWCVYGGVCVCVCVCVARGCVFSSFLNVIASLLLPPPPVYAPFSLHLLHTHRSTSMQPAWS